MIRRPPRSTQSRSSAASDVYKRQFLHGARVFATAGSEEKLARAQALGAYEVIHHHRHDIAEEIRRLTNRRGVDVVIEHVGEATWAKSVQALARGGRLVTCGATTGPNGALDLQALFARQLTIHGSYTVSYTHLRAHETRHDLVCRLLL